MIPPSPVLFLQSAQALILGYVALITPDTLLDVFAFTTRKGWQTPESIMVFRAFGITLLCIGVLTAVVASIYSKSTQQKVAACLLLWSVVGFIDCAISHQLSERRYALGAIVKDPTIPATVHFANMVMAIAVCSVAPADHGEIEESGNPGVLVVAGRGICWCCCVLALALIPKPTHSKLVGLLGALIPAHDFSGYLEAEARVVGIWTGVCLATLALAGLRVLK
jgi:hypothetical protein